MNKAAEFLRAEGWSLEDTHANNPYDYLAKKSGEEMVVEVKGTTGSGDSIFLTANELKTQRDRHPSNALVLVHSIALDRRTDPPSATGGVVKPIIRWKIARDRLEAKVFQYRVSD